MLVMGVIYTTSKWKDHDSIWISSENKCPWKMCCSKLLEPSIIYFIEESWLWNCYEYLYLSLNRVRPFFRRMKTWNILPWWRGFWGHYRNIWCLELSKGLVTLTALHSKSYLPAFLCGMKLVYFYISTCSYSQPTCREILPEGCTVGLAWWCNFKRKHEGSVEIASSAGNDCTLSLYFFGCVSSV